MKKWLKITSYVLGCLIVLSWIGRLTRKTTPAETAFTANQQKEAVIQAARPNAKRDLKISKFSWQKGEVGSVASHSFSIYNASKQHDYTRIAMRFFYYSDFGVEIGRLDQVMDKAIKVGETVHFDHIETGMSPQQTYGADLEIMN